MLSIKDGAPRKLNFYKTVKDRDIEAIKAKKLNNKDLFWEYHQLIFEGIQYPDNLSQIDIWKKYTKSQKTIFTLGHFISQTNNGGVWQFIFNKTELSLAAPQAIHEIAPYSILSFRYEPVFKGFIEMIENKTYEKICNIWNDESREFEERWKAFKSGEEIIPSTKEFDKLFFNKDKIGEFYKKAVSYIEQNLGKLINVESENQQKIIEKKEAVPHFSNYLEKEYKQVPTEVSIYYTARVTLNNQAAQLFLMKYKMPDGFESMGITGNFTYHLPDLDINEINRMHQKFHKQELVNMFHGCHLVSQELKSNPKAKKYEPKKWDALLKKLQQKGKTQIPVNVKLIEYIKFGENEWYIFSGDLLYNEKPDILPEDLSNVKVLAVSDKQEGMYRGEPGCIFHTQDKEKPGFGRGRINEPVHGKFKLYFTIGRQNKLIKDNPWGF